MKSTVSNKEKFIWNMLGSLSNASSSLVLSICANRILGGNDAGIFAFALANSQLMSTIGGFEVRPYQSTDVNEKYSFNTYFSFRIFTCILMMIASCGYIIINGFTVQKSFVILFMVMYKMVDCFGDVFGGRYQQKDRIDLPGKILFSHVVTATVAFILLLLMTGNLLLSTFGMFFSSFLLFFVYDYKLIFEDDRKNIKLETNSFIGLFKDVLPLFIGSFVLMYISNAPKYAIDNLYNDEMQNIYNILFMPAFVINLFSLFVFRPMIVDMTISWNERKLKKLWTSMFKVYGAISIFTVIALIGTWLLGIPALSFLYNIDLKPYKGDLMLVMFTGGISAVMSFSYYVVTIMRQQKLILLGYTVAFAYVTVISEILVRQYAITGAIIAYGTTVALIVIIYTIIILYTNFTKGKENERE